MPHCEVLEPFLNALYQMDHIFELNIHNIQNSIFENEVLHTFVFEDLESSENQSELSYELNCSSNFLKHLKNFNGCLKYLQNRESELNS